MAAGRLQSADRVRRHVQRLRLQRGGRITPVVVRRNDDGAEWGANAAPIAYVIGGSEFIANAFGGNRLERNRRVSPIGDALIVFGLPGVDYTGPRVINAAH
jgi:hypothetical protein